MKRIILLFAGLLPLLSGAFSNGSPMTGKRALGYVKIEGGGNFVHREKFRGGERACVIATGDHDPVVNLGLFIYDAQDRLVAQDEGPGDYVAVIWYPPRDAVYKIKVHNTGEQFNKCWISMK